MNKMTVPGVIEHLLTNCCHDVISTGETLCAVLQLLDEAGIGAENISILVVAEFPVHRGRGLLHQRGFSCINIQNLLVFGGS